MRAGWERRSRLRAPAVRPRWLARYRGQKDRRVESASCLNLFAEDFSRHAVELAAAGLEGVAALDLVREHDAEPRAVRRQRVAVAHRETAVDDVGVEARVVGRDLKDAGVGGGEARVDVLH